MSVQQDDLLSIGALAEATGIAPDTIRVWERRYGLPEPVRLPSGHRRYTPSQVKWMRRVAEALARGHRASRAVLASDEELERLLRSDQEAPGSKVVGEWIEMVRAYRLSALTEALWGAWRSLEPLEFLEERIVPLLDAVGEEWRDGRMNVRHEHFVSEIVEDLLRSVRLGLDASKNAGLVLLATLPGELHGLGLQMAALVCALGGARARIVGTETPMEEIVRAAEGTRADVVAVTLSLTNSGVESDRRLAELRRELPPEIHLVVGGGGVPRVRRGPRGVRFIKSLRDFARWLERVDIGFRSAPSID
ncbi:MAG: MerR family transcriptional regulator [Planctomycetota bacterium]